MTTTPSLIVFDCDGTLVDGQHLIVEAMRRAFEEAGLAAPARSAILRTAGLSIPEALKQLAPDLHPEERAGLTGAYRDWSTTLRRQPALLEPLFQGAASLLSALAASENVLLGIATGKSRRGVRRFIEQNGLQGIFATVQTADDAPSKPHPAMLMQAIAEAGSIPGTTIMVGDTFYDMMMATSAGVMGVGVSWGYHAAAELKRGGAKAIVQSFAALEQVLLGMCRTGRRREAAV